MDDSGQFDVRRLRRSPNFGTWLTMIAMGAGLVAAWATNGNRLANVEQQQTENKAEVQRMEAHISSDDSQIAVLATRLQVIIEQLAEANAKLDRLEEERRK